MLLDPEASPRWQSNRLNLMLKGRRSELMPKPADIRDWGYSGNSAWVVVDLAPDSPDFGLFSTALRFFRFADQRWYLTSAEVVFSGPPLHLSTDHLEFRYRELDAPLMKSITPNVDALYRQTARDLGVELEPGKRLAIMFVYEPNLAPSPFGGGLDEVMVPAPRLFEDLQTFRFFLGFTIANGLATEVVAREPQAMGLLMNGIAMWEAEQWGAFPFWEAGKQAEIQRRLRESNFPSLSHRYPEIPELTTLIEYVAATYGRPRLTDLVQAVGGHQSLQDLIPAVLGVDVETFEAGWREYLERAYGP